MRNRIRQAAIPAFVHLCISALLACLAFVLVFWVWFPAPYDQLLAGRDLFWLMISVDLVCGPLLTSVVFDRRKPRRELFVDLAVIATLQCAALFYGLWSVSLARPVVLAFEKDRFRVITVAEVFVKNGSPDVVLPWFSVLTTGVSVMAPSDPDYLDSLEYSLKGIPPSARPELWIPYGNVSEEVGQSSGRLADLRRKHPDSRGLALLNDAVSKSGTGELELGYWPLESHLHNDWVVLVGRSDGQIKHLVHLDAW